MTKEEQSSIPGIFFIRFKFNHENLYDESKQKNNNRNHEDEIMAQIMEESYMASLNEFELDEYLKQKSLDVSEKVFIEDTIKMDPREFYVMGFDMRVLIKNPIIPIPFGNYTFKLTDNQIVRLVDQWTKVNPDTTKGIKYRQNLDYGRALVQDRIRKNY
jgi:hypothetical protein